MKTFRPLGGLLLFAFLFLSFSGASAQQLFKAYLSGQNEVLPVPTLAKGEITAYLAGQKIVVFGSFSGLSSDLATDILGGVHLHFGMAGQTGAVLIPLRVRLDADGRGGTIDALDNIHTLTVAQMDYLLKRRIYVNVHTNGYRTGEIRGQLLPLAEEYYHANLFGSNEVPAVMTQASGALDLELSGNQLVVSGSFQNLTGDLNTAIAGGVHIHNGLAGQNGGISLLLTTNLDAGQKSGLFVSSKNTFTLTDDQLEALRGRRWYVNLHSTAFPGGEIRGQVVGHSRSVFRAHLAGVNSVPSAVVTTATGILLAEVQDENTIILSGNFDNLESEVATQILGGMHLHKGLAGQTGPVELSVASVLSADSKSGEIEPASNTLTVNMDQMNNLYNRAFYYNIHTNNNIGGELRGQLLHESQMYFTALLSGTQESNPVPAQGYGAVKGELSGNRLVLSGAFNGLGSEINAALAGGMHIHSAYAGSNGPVTLRILPTLFTDLKSGRVEVANNNFILSDTEAADLRSRRFYANVHSVNVPSGELRGQMLFEANNYYFASLAGESQTPPVNSGGTGLLALELTGTRALITGSFNQLSSPFNAAIAGGAHVHKGHAGRNGGIELALQTTASTDLLSGTYHISNNNFSLSSDQASDLRSRMFYVNIHSQDYPAGEIRGQFLPPAMAYYTTSLSALNQLVSTPSVSDGSIKVELRGDRIVLSGSFNNLGSDFNPAIAGGAHLHIGTVGNNGAVAVRLSPTVDVDNKGGIFLAANNSFVLSPDNVNNLRTGGFYANIHTIDNPAGEPRGQILAERNLFPVARAITLPANGAAITIEGAPSTPFEAQWSSGTDATTLIYVWQLAADPDFNNILFQTNTGLVTSFVTDFATVDGLLEAAGVAIGETITLYHRNIASDGSLRHPGPAASVVITREMLDGSRPVMGKPFLAPKANPGTGEWTIFPNPVLTELTIQWDSQVETLEDLLIFDVQGRLVYREQLAADRGFNQKSLMVSDWKDGLYFVKIGNSKTYRIIKTSGF